MADENQIELEIIVDRPDSDSEERNQMAINLIQHLAGDTAWTAQQTRGGLPEHGTKTGELITWGSIAIAVLPTAVPSLISMAQEWASRAKDRTVKFKYKGMEYEGSREDLEKLLDKIGKRKGKKKKK